MNSVNICIRNVVSDLPHASAEAAFAAPLQPTRRAQRHLGRNIGHRRHNHLTTLPATSSQLTATEKEQKGIYLVVPGTVGGGDGESDHLAWRLIDSATCQGFRKTIL